MQAPIIRLIPQSSGPARPRAPSAPTAFHRRELSAILRVYGRMVAAGEWRDYAIDHLSDSAVFSIFRRTAEAPLFRIVKRPDLAQKQGAYAILGVDGRVLKRGRDLDALMRFFDRRLDPVD